MTVDVSNEKKRHEKIEWTDEMDNIIIESVREKGVNQGLLDAGEILGFSWYNCRNRWYKKNLNRHLLHGRRNSSVIGKPSTSVGSLKFPINFTKKNIQKIEQIDLPEDVDAITNLRKISKYITTIKNNEKILKAKLDRVIAEKESIERKYKEVEEHYKTVLRIINQARIAAVDSEIQIDRDDQHHKFRMEQNGNLVHVNNSEN